MKKHVSIWIICGIAAILIFANLGNQFLWQDEAETAVLAERVLEYGFPKAFDGENLINPTIRTGYAGDYGWKYHPWSQFYVTALSFKIFGANTFTARLPFAILGVLSVLLLYILAYRLTANRFIAGCSAFLMTFSIPYLLFMRQCRYYAPAVFLILLILIFYSKFLERRSRGPVVMFSSGLIALGYTVHGMFIPLFIAIGLHYLIFAFDKKTFKKILPAGLIVIMAVLPWFMYSGSASHMAVITPVRLWKNLEFQFRMVNKFIFPILFFGIVYLIRAVWKRKSRIYLTEGEKKAVTLILAVSAVSITVFCFAQERNFRYLVYFIPLFAILEAMILLRLVNFSRVLFSLFILISISTGVFNMGYPNYYLPRYLCEITHDYDGPIEGITRFLNKNARAGDTVKIIYGDIPVMFYTDLKVDNSQIYDAGHMPEWIVFRRDWGESLDDDYYSRITRVYKKHVLPYPDIKWENRPGDLDYHRFRTDTEAPGVVIFEKDRGRT
ncbi:MAG: glycosyltransferase family 39 protein [Candidatus Omnitrophica bacterium]|nr:glycosyltransferase family 39 protein [Candidatus Omnitrophota bacterium]MBU1128566.1 glycosyltransferase family 39 protein [Candidatus Omnitrophota bacterium]MBU1657286.1 glycosyltransferase family 39 protein [Candidatus Omnitrophota bacterium]MBU1784780.1 glycosyltransferase family 39 protein [Candidatus Omnitrophota bacterium]MBU1851570.1 glycosyltransferase family 39 protein [Candidatus Omnitrophota bacterium]